MPDRKEDSHVKILEACSRLLRKQGVKSASVAKVMREAGLTVGGFYAHFQGKDHMVEEGFRMAMRQAKLSGRDSLPAELGPDGKWRAYLKKYLSTRHRDQDRDGQGCAVSALAADMSRGSPELRKVFAEECQKLVFECIELFSAEGARMRRGDFLASLSTYVGGLILARATRGSPISEEILEACLGRLGARAGDAPEAPPATDAIGGVR